MSVFNIHGGVRDGRLSPAPDVFDDALQALEDDYGVDLPRAGAVYVLGSLYDPDTEQPRFADVAVGDYVQVSRPSVDFKAKAYSFTMVLQSPQIGVWDFVVLVGVAEYIRLPLPVGRKLWTCRMTIAAANDSAAKDLHFRLERAS